MFLFKISYRARRLKMVIILMLTVVLLAAISHINFSNSESFLKLTNTQNRNTNSVVIEKQQFILNIDSVKRPKLQVLEEVSAVTKQIQSINFTSYRVTVERGKKVFPSRHWADNFKGDAVIGYPSDNTTAAFIINDFVQKKNNSRKAKQVTNKHVGRFNESNGKVAEGTWSDKKDRFPKYQSLKHRYRKTYISKEGVARGESSDNSIDETELDQYGLNAHVWYSLCTRSFSALCNHPKYPLFPDKSQQIRGKLNLQEWKEKSVTLRVFGFLIPPESGHYR